MIRASLRTVDSYCTAPHHSHRYDDKVRIAGGVERRQDVKVTMLGANAAPARQDAQHRPAAPQQALRQVHGQERRVEASHGSCADVYSEAYRAARFKKAVVEGKERELYEHHRRGGDVQADTDFLNHDEREKSICWRPSRPAE